MDTPAQRVNSEESQADHTSEDQMLAVLHRSDVTASEIADLARSADAVKNRKTAAAIVAHPRTPRHISLPLLRRMFTFDLMQVTLTPSISADIKRAAEEQILRRIESLPAGEKISLARRASGRVAAALLQESDARVVTVALDNPQLTEALVVQALMKFSAPDKLFVLASGHNKWSQRREILLALLRSTKTPIETARVIAKYFSAEILLEVVPEERRPELLKDAEEKNPNHRKVDDVD